MSERLSKRLADLKSEGRAGFVPFIMAGDPDMETSLSILKQLPANGADIIEVGVPFSDPMADGPTIQAAGIRSLASGTKLDDVFAMVSAFREDDSDTPIILMGYYNPLYHTGLGDFMGKASAAGVDGLIIVDVPSEEIAPLKAAADAKNIDIVRLIAPTSLEGRLPAITDTASGFLYYISIKGVTGTSSANYDQLEKDIAIIKAKSELPVAVGFGINTPDDVKTVSAFADLVVVGSALVKQVEEHNKESASYLLKLCKTLSNALR